MSKKLKISLFVGLGLVVVAGAAAAVSSRNKGVVSVIAAKVKMQDIVAKVTANGKIQAENKVDLSALVMGQIVNLVVREGDRVKKGDFLLQIDKNRAAAEEAGSAAALQASLRRPRLRQGRHGPGRARLRARAAELRGADRPRGRLPARPVDADDRADGAYEAAEQRIEQNRAGLNANHDTVTKSTVRAPIDGIVTTLRVKAGEVTVIGTMNNPGTQLMTISDMSTVQAVLMVDETDTPNIAVGQKAMLTLDSYPGRKFDGVVTEVGQLADPEGRHGAAGADHDDPRRSTSR